MERKPKQDSSSSPTPSYKGENLKYYWQEEREQIMGISNNGGVDRISSLPSEILEHILFFTRMRQAVQLSILSSRWKNLWKSMPDLYFDARDFPPTDDQNRSLFLLDQKVMTLRTGRVRKLHIVMMCVESCQSIRMSAIRWFDCAALCHADELCVSYGPLSCIHMIENLSVDKYPGIINFGTLRILNIWCMNDPDTAFEPPSDALPVLENLSMRGCCFKAIDLSFSRLKVLILCNCFAFGGKFRVATPILESFDYRDFLSDTCKLENLPSLRDASIDIRPRSGDALLGVLRAIQNASSIRLSWRTLEAYCKRQCSFSCLPTFHNAKHVTLRATGTGNIILTKHLMQKWPNIETLTITNRYDLFHSKFSISELDYLS